MQKLTRTRSPGRAPLALPAAQRGKLFPPEIRAARGRELRVELNGIPAILAHRRVECRAILRFAREPEQGIQFELVSGEAANGARRDVALATRFDAQARGQLELLQRW